MGLYNRKNNLIVSGIRETTNGNVIQIITNLAKDKSEQQYKSVFLC